MTEDTRDDQRVDDLRRQLRALGYLDAGVDRFVLGSARATRRPALIAALASVRVGLLAAALLGPAAAVGIASRLPGLITGPRDASIVAVYLGTVFGLALTAFTFVLSVVFSRVVQAAGVQRARWISRGAGALVTIGCLTYLTLWWRSTNAGLAWASPIWTLSALAVAVSISLLLGHGVAITTFAVMAARRGTNAGRSSDAAPIAVSRSTWRLVAAAASLAFVGAVALLFLTTPAASRTHDRPPLAVVSPGFRVKVIGIDGFDLQVFESMRAAGELPVLSRLAATARARFAIDQVRDPAREWMTTATGQPPEVHGVRGLETRRVAGLHGASRRAATKGSHARSWCHGSAASDSSFNRQRHGASSEAVLGSCCRRRAARGGGELVGDLAGVRRAHVCARRGIRPCRAASRTRWCARRGDLAEGTVREAARRMANHHSGGGTCRVGGDDLRRGLACGCGAATIRRSSTRYNSRLSRRLLTDKPDLVAVYLPGLDIVQHTLLDPAAGSGASVISARLEAVRRYYAYLDMVLTDFVRSAPDEIVIVVTHPGRRSSAQGMIAVTGAIAAPGADVMARSVDIAPTILHVLGVPVSRELAGTPIVGMFSPSFVTRFPVRDVPTYGARQPVASTGRGNRSTLRRSRGCGAWDT